MRLILTLSLLVCGRLLAQHNDFQSLYMYDALTINPAYAGNKGALNVNVNYRNQWTGIVGSPKTLSFGAHALTKSKNVGLGFTILNDKYGIQNNLRINGIYAYRLRIKESTLSFGVAAGMRNESIDYSALNLVEQNDMTFINQYRRGVLLDVGLGAMFKSKSLLVGFSMPNTVRIHQENVLQGFNGYACYVFDVNKNIKLKPTTLVKYVTNSPLSYEGNLTLYYKQLVSFGFGVRSSKAGNLYARVQLNDQFAVAYLYERGLGTQGQLWRNTHEVMINYTFDYKSNVQSPRYL